MRLFGHHPRHRRGDELPEPGFGDIEWPVTGSCEWCGGPLLELWLCGRSGKDMIATRYAGMPGLDGWDSAPLGLAGSWPLPRLTDVHQFCGEGHMLTWQQQAGWASRT